MAKPVQEPLGRQHSNDLDVTITFRKATFKKNKASEKQNHEDQEKVRREKEADKEYDDTVVHRIISNYVTRSYKKSSVANQMFETTISV